MTLRGAARFVLHDLDPWDNDQAVRRRLYDLQLIPDRAHVLVVVGAVYPSMEAVRMIRAHVDRLDIEIQADAAQVRAWLDAVSGRDDVFSALATTTRVGGVSA